MTLEDLKRAILELPLEQRMALMKEIGPAMCDAAMGQPEAMMELLPRCREMMAGHPGMVALMRKMMGDG